jgi:hypothetical protein
VHKNKTKKKQQRTLTGYRLLWVHRNKTRKNHNKHQLVIVFSQCIEKKRDNDKHWLIIIFFQCIETKQKK